MPSIARRACALVFSCTTVLGCSEDFISGRARTDAGLDSGAGGADETGGRRGTGGKKATGGSGADGSGGTAGTAGDGGAGGASGNAGNDSGTGAGGRDSGTGTGGGDSGTGAGGSDSGTSPCGLAVPTPPPDAIVAECAIGNPPIVDGQLGDWPAALFSNVVTHASAEASGTWDTDEAANERNLSAAFAVRWDQDALYVAGRVHDDFRSTPDPAHFYMNDAFEVFVDGNGDAGEYGPDDIQILFDAAGRSQANHFPTLDPFAVPSGVTSAVTSTGVANWNVEIRIPWSIVGAPVHALGDVIGFDLGLDDNDSGARDRALMWRNSAPTGCACAQAPNPKPCEPYCHTMTFGKVMLGG